MGYTVTPERGPSLQARQCQSTTLNTEQPQQASNPDPAPHRVFHMEGECASPGDHKAVLAAVISRLGGRVVCLAVSRLSGNRPTSAETNRSSAIPNTRCCRQLPIITITLRYSIRIKGVGRADNHPTKRTRGQADSAPSAEEMTSRSFSRHPHSHPLARSRSRPPHGFARPNVPLPTPSSLASSSPR